MTITRILYHPITIIAITVVAIMFFFSLDKSGKRTQSSSENIKILEYEVNQISSDIINLEEKIEKTNSEQFKEKVIRNELLMQKPGEYVIQITENQEDNNNEKCENSDCPSSADNQQTPVLSAWRKLLF